MYTAHELFNDPSECDSFHDAVTEFFHRSFLDIDFNARQLHLIFNLLPVSIRDEAHVNGLSDTVFRDSVYDYICKTPSIQEAIQKINSEDEIVMREYQNRVVQEKAELDAKREKLGEFKNKADFSLLPWQEQERLNTQAHLMTCLSAVLGARISAFESEVK